jgi:hypothetical protein
VSRSFLCQDSGATTKTSAPARWRQRGRNDDYRIEIVANLTAYLAGEGPYERLTLTAAEIRARAEPRLYDVPLGGKEDEILRRATRRPRPRPECVVEYLS